MSPSERTIPATAGQPRDQALLGRGRRRQAAGQALHRVRRAHHYPRAICPFCGSDRTEWTEASGRGTVYSYSVFRRAPMPYAIAYVTLAEGPTMMTNIVDCNLDTIRIGQAVRVVFKPTEDGPPVPMFAPA